MSHGPQTIATARASSAKTLAAAGRRSAALRWAKASRHSSQARQGLPRSLRQRKETWHIRQADRCLQRHTRRTGACRVSKVKPPLLRFLDQVADDPTINPTGFAVAYAFCRAADWSGDTYACWPSIPALAAGARAALRTVQAQTDELENAGHLYVHRPTNRRAGNIYIMIVKDQGVGAHSQRVPKAIERYKALVRSTRNMSAHARARAHEKTRAVTDDDSLSYAASRTCTYAASRTRNTLTEQLNLSPPPTFDNPARARALDSDRKTLADEETPAAAEPHTARAAPEVARAVFKQISSNLAQVPDDCRRTRPKRPLIGVAQRDPDREEAE
jgi:hypothetical protein